MPDITTALQGSLRNLSISFDRALVGGLNRAGQEMLVHIKLSAPVRTGALVNSYTILRRATTADKTVVIGNQPALNYADRYYPHTQNRGRRPRFDSARPSLFGPGTDSARQRLIQDCVNEEIVKEVRRG